MTETITFREIEWTNPLTLEAETCTVTAEVDEDNEVELVRVTWERTGEDCNIRYISSEVREELKENFLDRLAEEAADDE